MAEFRTTSQLDWQALLDWSRIQADTVNSLLPKITDEVSITDVSSALVALFALVVAGSSLFFTMRNERQNRRYDFWSQIMQQAIRNNEFSGGNGIPGPRTAAQRDAAYEARIQCFKEALEADRQRNDDTRAAALRSVFFNQVNIAFLAYQASKAILSPSDRDRFHNWFIGVIEWASLFPADLGDTIGEIKANSALLYEDKFVQDWVKPALEKVSQKQA